MDLGLLGRNRVPGCNCTSFRRVGCCPSRVFAHNVLNSRLKMRTSSWSVSLHGLKLTRGTFRSVFGEFQVNLENNAPNQPSSRTIPTYLSLFIFGFVYQTLLAYDGLRLRNEIQIIGLCLLNLGLFIDGAIQYDQVFDTVTTLASGEKGIRHIDPGFWDKVKPQLIAIPTILGLGTVLLSIVAWKLHGEFAWSIYKAISADLKLKRRYLSYQVCKFVRVCPPAS